MENIKEITNFKYVSNGKLRSVDCKFKGYFEDKIALFECEGDNIIRALKQSDGTTVILKSKNVDNENIRIWHMLHRVYFMDKWNKSNISISDICCAYKYGFNNMISIIKQNKEIRIKGLESAIRHESSNEKLNIPSDNEVLSILSASSLNKNME